MKKHTLCSGNITGNSAANKINKKTGLNGLNGSTNKFSVDYRTFDISLYYQYSWIFNEKIRYKVILELFKNIHCIIN